MSNRHGGFVRPMEKFGEKLRILRKRDGLSMRALAAELDFSSHGTISDLETGRIMPSTKHVIKVARLFDVTTDQLLFDELEID
ncbi:helix-turn-helix transcriptional regulator [Anaerolineales bacterium HSG25]|nr:helix-turn-helix transcriptional regulator [Anaerolineales bacterium HSG25]